MAAFALSPAPIAAAPATAAPLMKFRRSSDWPFLFCDSISFATSRSSHCTERFAARTFYFSFGVSFAQMPQPTFGAQYISARSRLPD
jgi:hypothetical protein